MSKKKNAKKTPMPNSTKKGIMLISLLAILVLVVSIITASYSWFSPKSVKGTGINYHTDVRFRSENCTVTHYVGSKDANGVISYTKIDNPTTVTINASTSADTIAYYMTNITNNDPKYPTVVSVYMSDFPEANRTFGFGIAAPSNSYRQLTAQQHDYYFVRNAFISQNDNSDDATLSVEWFVKVPQNGSSVTIDLRKMFIMFN